MTINDLLILVIALPVFAYLTNKVSLIVHEVGHFLVLKYVYKIKEAGIGFGNVENKEKGSIKLGSTKIYFYRIFPLKMSGSNAFVFPWREVHEGNKGKRVLFYSAGYMAEMLLSLLLLMILNVFRNDLTTLPYIFLVTAILITGISALLSVLLGFRTKKVFVSESARHLLKVEFGYYDGAGVLLNSKPIFGLTLMVSLYYSYFIIKAISRPYF